jgi:hypothetical protein
LSKDKLEVSLLPYHLVIEYDDHAMSWKLFDKFLFID